MTDKHTQGRRIIEHLKRRPMTYMEMQMLGISTCPWRRVAECLAPDERLLKLRSNGRVRWKVKQLIGA